MNAPLNPQPNSRFREYDSRTTTTLRDVSPSDVAGTLRSLLGLAPDEPAPGELAASIGRTLPAKVERLDVGAWIAWCLTGLPLFSGRFPKLLRVRAAADRVVMALAMTDSAGVLTKASVVLRVSRQTLRDHLRGFGLHPWHRRAMGEQHHGRAGR